MRANTTEGTTRTDYVYVGHDPWYERSKSGSTQTTTDYIYVNGGLKAKIVAGGSSPGTYFYMSDALGSVRQVWKQGGTSSSFSVSTYKPFGTPVGTSGTADKVGYAGELIDTAAGTSPGLYYIGARWMDPELGRFVSMDPIVGRLSFQQSMNRYTNCANNPLRSTDPTGLMTNYRQSTHRFATQHPGSWQAGLIIIVVGTVSLAAIVFTFGLATPEVVAIDATLIGGELAADVGADTVAGLGAETAIEAAAAGEAGSDFAGFFASMDAECGVGSEASDFAWFFESMDAECSNAVGSAFQPPGVDWHLLADSLGHYVKIIGPIEAAYAGGKAAFGGVKHNAGTASYLQGLASYGYVGGSAVGVRHHASFVFGGKGSGLGYSSTAAATAVTQPYSGSYSGYGGGGGIARFC
jgi:RHS repeat-associated protein